MRCSIVSTKTSASPAGNSDGDLQGELQGGGGARGSAGPCRSASLINIMASSYEVLLFTTALRHVIMALPSLKLGKLRQKGVGQLEQGRHS